MAEPTKSADVRVRYAGGVFVVEPLSPAGEAWLDRTVPNRPPGGVHIAMRLLDDVLSRIRQARLQLQVPWDLSASQLVADCRQRAIECAEKAKATTSNTDREFFLDMEGRWLFLAGIYEFTDRRSSLSNELDRHQNECEQ
jgi:hypothetical protein